MGEQRAEQPCWVLRPRHMPPDACLDLAESDEHFPTESAALQAHLAQVMDEVVLPDVDCTVEHALEHLDWYASQLLEPCHIGRCAGCAHPLDDEESPYEEVHFDTWSQLAEAAASIGWHVLYQDQVLWCDPCWSSHPWHAELAAAETQQRPHPTSEDQLSLSLPWLDLPGETA